MIETGVSVREKALAAWEEHQRQMIEKDAQQVERQRRERLEALRWEIEQVLGLTVDVTEEVCVVEGIPFGLHADYIDLGVWQSCPDCGEYQLWESVKGWRDVGRILSECIRFAGADEPQTVRQEPCRECIERREAERIGKPSLTVWEQLAAEDPVDAAALALTQALGKFIRQVMAE